MVLWSEEDGSLSNSSLLFCCRILQQLRKDHVGVQAPDRRRFSSFDDALQRLLPYHVFQGAPPSREEFSQGGCRCRCRRDGQRSEFLRTDLWSPSAVDEEFEDVATAVLSRTCAMVNKYRRLLLVEAEVGMAGPLLLPVLLRSDSFLSPAAFQPFLRNGDDRQDLQPGRAQHPDAGQAAGPRRSRSEDRIRRLSQTLPLTSPFLLYRQLFGRVLLWDEI